MRLTFPNTKRQTYQALILLGVKQLKVDRVGGLSAYYSFVRIDWRVILFSGYLKL